MCTHASTATNRALAPFLALGLAGVLALTGCASPASRGDFERRLTAIEQRIAAISVAAPAETDASQVERLRAEIARLQGDLNDVRFLLLDLQMKAGR